MPQEQCRECRYYRIELETTRDLHDDRPLHEEDYEAECRRFPPVRGDADYYGRMGQMGVLRDHFSGPVVQAGYWCGEWKRRDDTTQNTE